MELHNSLIKTVGLTNTLIFETCFESAQCSKSGLFETENVILHWEKEDGRGGGWPRTSMIKQCVAKPTKNP